MVHGSRFWAVNLFNVGTMTKEEYQKYAHVKLTDEQMEELEDRYFEHDVYAIDEQHLLIVGQPYTRRQIHHRHQALLKGYYYMEDCSEQSGERYNIYYDENTERSEKFERNLQKDGFTLIKWTED